MDNETKSSIEKLRKLREKLCEKQSDWQHAFKVKDAVIKELKCLKMLAEKPDSDKSQIAEKINHLLSIFIDKNDPPVEDCDG